MGNKAPDSEVKKSKKKKTARQIVAMAGVILLAFLYVITLIVAVFDRSDSGKWFMICIFATAAVPLLIWIYTWMYGKLTGKHTIADAEQVQQEEK